MNLCCVFGAAVLLMRLIKTRLDSFLEPEQVLDVLMHFVNVFVTGILQIWELPPKSCSAELPS